MKDHKRWVIWLDYFNSSLACSHGRKVPLNISVKNPRIDELLEAVKQIGLGFEHVEAVHPKRVGQKTHYISVEKTKPKTKMMTDIAKKLAAVRGGVAT
ncbi:MAG: hypothetical protein HY619_02450 [Thaumarchaeota archaeon]|nr:hypothetical protein [Nitrososphaerota archaeon]